MKSGIYKIVSKRTSNSRTSGEKPSPKEQPCRKCTGRCCRYFALQIDTPRSWDDYDNIRWYLSHREVTVFVEKGKWYLNIKNPCRHLSKRDFRCRNYDLRPHICRTYSTDSCDLNGSQYDYQMYFQNDRHMEEYMRTKFGAGVFDKLQPAKADAGKSSRKGRL